MKLKDLITILESAYPPELAYDWDNVGLLVGDGEREIRKILLTLDINSNIAEEARTLGVDLILSHHPILLGGISRIDYGTETGRMLKTLIENNICVFSAHTNLDTAAGGINTHLATLFGLEAIEILEQTGEDTGLGRIGNLPEATTLSDFSRQVKSTLITPMVRIVGDPDRQIRRVALGSGSCSDLIPLAKSKGADVMVTADLKYHTAMDAALDGIAVIDAGHYPTEIAVMDLFEELLKPYGFTLVRSENKDVFLYV